MPDKLDLDAVRSAQTTSLGLSAYDKAQLKMYRDIQGDVPVRTVVRDTPETMMALNRLKDSCKKLMAQNQHLRDELKVAYAEIDKLTGNN